MQYNLEGSPSAVSEMNPYAVSDNLVQIEQEYFPKANKQQKPHAQRRPSVKIWKSILIGGDLILLTVLLTIFLGGIPYFYAVLGLSFYDPQVWNPGFKWTCLLLLTWILAISATRAHEIPKARDRFKSVICVLCAFILMFLLWVTVAYLFISTGVLVYINIFLCFFVLAAPIICTWRIVAADIMCLPSFRRRAVIIGTSLPAKIIAKELQGAKRPQITLQGYISEDANAQSPDHVPVLGGRDVLRCLAQERLIDMVITAVDDQEGSVLFQEAIELSELGVSVVPMTTVYEEISRKLPVENYRNQWYLMAPVEAGERTLLYFFWRRALDLVFGLTGTAVLLLLFPFLAALIRLSSPGPVFYRQKRLGFQGKPLYIYKFRSMRMNAESTGSPIWATKGDPRVTKIGRFMRATHLDELPQILNILRGEMSLIGPRPERQEFARELEKTYPFYRARLLDKPGLTGWAQVKYGYGNTMEDAIVKLQYDLYYIKHKSFLLDVLIILKTVLEVVSSRGI